MNATSRSRVRPLRLDDLLVERGLVESRAKARALILARTVRVDGDIAVAAAAPTAVDAALELATGRRYVSRGGDKLVHALDRSGITVDGARCLDIGASTGGFTDCLLQHGAAHVTAVDVAYGELATQLRDDPRVEVRERTNARSLTVLSTPVDIVTADVAFISLTAVLPAALLSLRSGGDVLALVKPQFEAARDQVPRGGVIQDSAVHASTVARVALWAIDQGLRVRDVIRSPLLGPAGNREFFLWLRMP